MVCSELAVTLQCLGKLYSRTMYSGTQRNIYEHIYKFIHPSTENPPALKIQWLKANCLEWICTGKYSGPETLRGTYVQP